MRLGIVFIAGVLGCGSVQSDPPQLDAPAGDGAAVCTIHDSIESCGAACVRCPTATERSTPTCDGVACGVTCANAAPRCSDGSCSRLTWTFDSNMLDGLTALQPAGLTPAVRNHGGNLALALDIAQLQGNEIQLRVPVCLSGHLQLQTRTLRATLFIEDTPSMIDQYYVQAAVPAPMDGAFLTARSVPSAAYFTYTAPISQSQYANTAAQIVFQIGSFGGAFSGRIWIDDIAIE